MRSGRERLRERRKSMKGMVRRCLKPFESIHADGSETLRTAVFVSCFSSFFVPFLVYVTTLPF